MSSCRRVGVHYPHSAAAVDAIDDYCGELARAFRDAGWSVERRTVLSHRASDVDLLLVQYNPFSYGRWGVAPRLAFTLARLRRRRTGPVVVVVVHETFVPIDGVRSLMMGAAQRLQLWAVSAAADKVVHTMQSWAERLGDRRPRRPVEHVAVGANVPDARHRRESTRADRGWDDQTLVVASLAGAHPSKLNTWIAPALAAVASAGKRVVHADLGGAPLGIEVDGVEAYAPGYLEAGELAAHLAAADLFLAPYIDGVSGRRGSLMAGLRNGVAVLSTVCAGSDDLLVSPEGGLTLVDVGDLAGFVSAARTLAVDDELRHERGDLGAKLYAERIDWPVIADRLGQLAGLGFDDERIQPDPDLR